MADDDSIDPLSGGELDRERQPEADETSLASDLHRLCGRTRALRGPAR